MPQNMKTEPNELVELPDLDAQEERLVEALASGASNADAYRTAYGAEGYSLNALYVQASRKVASDKIQAHLRALRAVGQAKAVLSLEECIRDELAFAQRAEDAGNFGAAGGARDRRNKLLGLYVDKIQDVTNDTDPVRTLKDIAAIAGDDVAASLANKHGIEWAKPETATTH